MEEVEWYSTPEKQSFWSKYKQAIISSCLWGVVILLILFLPRNINPTNFQTKLDSLENVIMLKGDSINQSKQREIYWVNVVNQKDSAISANTNKINKLNKKYDEKIKSIDNYNSDSLHKFFTDRYQ